MNWLKGLTKKRENYYKSIDDLPLFNWIKLTNGELEYSRRNKNKGTKELDEKHFEMIYDDYLTTFGLSKMYVRLLEAMKKKALIELDYILTGDRMKITLAELEAEKLKTMLNNNKSTTTIEQTLIHLSKWLGQWINSKKITAREYFDLCDEFSKYNKSLKNGEKNK